MFVFAGAVCALVGLGVLLQGIRADAAVRRWRHTSGRILSASRGRLTEDGRELWDVQIAYRDDAGQDHTRSVRQVGTDLDRRCGEAVEVWFDPRRPERADARLQGNASGSAGWVQYCFGGLFLLVGSLVLAAALA